MKFVRITCANVQDDDDKFVMDIIIDLNDQPVQNRYIGCHGSIATDNPSHAVYPFILRKDGKFDYGSGYDHDARYGTTNLLSKKICIGEYVTFSYPGENMMTHTGTYRINRVVDLIKTITDS